MEQGNGILKQHEIEFTGSGKEYFGIWIVNILLTILTLGIYSAWAKVRNRKYFYNNTLLEGSPFDYLANPVAILKGWAIAATVLIAYNVFFDIYPAVAMAILAFIIAMTPWVVVRSMRFNLINTSYRNVRFNFKKNYKDSSKVFLGWLFLSFISLGLVFPLYYYKQRKFVMDNAGYGRDGFGLEDIGGGFYRLFLKIIGIYILFFVALAFLSGSISFGINMVGESAKGFGLAVNMLMQLVIYAFLVFVAAYFEVRKNNLVWNNASLNQHRFMSELEVWPMFKIYLTNLIAIILSLGLFIPWAKVRSTRYRLEHTKMLAAHDLDGYVSERMQEQNALGDQLGDAFDIEIGL